VYARSEPLGKRQKLDALEHLQGAAAKRKIAAVSPKLRPAAPARSPMDTITTSFGVYPMHQARS